MFKNLENIDGKPIPSSKNGKETGEKRSRVEDYQSRKRHKPESAGKDEDNDSKDIKYILPKTVPTMPAPIPERKKHIEHIAAILIKKDPSNPTPRAQAVEIEYEIARNCNFRTYAQSLRNQVYKLQHPEKVGSKAGAKTRPRSQEMSLLSSMVLAEKTLQKFGYVMEIPRAQVEKESSSLTRECRRCGTEFNVSRQLEPTTCKFHHGKLRKREGTKMRYYDCCNASQDDQKTCDEAEHHVFQLDKPEQKHQVLPYFHTSEMFQSGGEFDALGIDCEMGFTTKGFELMRITAVDYFSLKTVLDIYVLPFGEVVDFNTRYSGISKIDKEFVSFNQAMQQLGTVMDKETILIGHGLENDMNAMRLIHKKIIDTSVLYPRHEATPTFRWRLKDLAFKYLSKNIQMGEHDSAEDSVAAIEIVKFHLNKAHPIKE
ncbi:uncharacterized protein LODBEIA_P07880 [Lodderomyces beijingensis]|uniref:RNA exonuclease 3 n=1 Tax=Lodderomyces beijingensis TaxID=1775926 RepID=A0ABP0ZEI3_9ASCO